MAKNKIIGESDWKAELARIPLESDDIKKRGSESKAELRSKRRKSSKISDPEVLPSIETKKKEDVSMPTSEKEMPGQVKTGIDKVTGQPIYADLSKVKIKAQRSMETELEDILNDIKTSGSSVHEAEPKPITVKLPESKEITGLRNKLSPDIKKVTEAERKYAHDALVAFYNHKITERESRGQRVDAAIYRGQLQWVEDMYRRAPQPTTTPAAPASSRKIDHKRLEDLQKRFRLRNNEVSANEAEIKANIAASVKELEDEARKLGLNPKDSYDKAGDGKADALENLVKDLEEARARKAKEVEQNLPSPLDSSAVVEPEPQRSREEFDLAIKESNFDRLKEIIEKGDPSLVELGRIAKSAEKAGQWELAIQAEERILAGYDRQILAEKNESRKKNLQKSRQVVVSSLQSFRARHESVSKKADKLNGYLDDDVVFAKGADFGVDPDDAVRHKRTKGETEKTASTEPTPSTEPTAVEPEPAGPIKAETRVEVKETAAELNVERAEVLKNVLQRLDRQVEIYENGRNWAQRLHEARKQNQNDQAAWGNARGPWSNYAAERGQDVFEGFDVARFGTSSAEYRQAMELNDLLKKDLQPAVTEAIMNLNDQALAGKPDPSLIRAAIKQQEAVLDRIILENKAEARTQSSVEVNPDTEMSRIKLKIAEKWEAKKRAAMAALGRSERTINTVIEAERDEVVDSLYQAYLARKGSA